jgi:hypothetical protein
MTRAVSLLFHFSGTGFLLALGLWGYVLRAQRAVPFNPLQPAWALKSLSTLVVMATTLCVLATLLSAASSLRARVRRARA